MALLFNHTKMPMPRGAKPIDLSGQKFGRLTAVKMTRTSRGIMWKCVCECGNSALVATTDLRQGHSQSCGCRKIAMLKSRVTKHGASASHLYMIWSSMISRCHRPTSKSFEFYGARGIAVCEEWRNSFERFADDMGTPPKGSSIERIDNNIGYSKDNCRWADKITQMNNRRNNIIISFDGKQLPMAQFARLLGFHYARVRSAIKRGVTNIGGYEISVARRHELETSTQPGERQ